MREDTRKLRDRLRRYKRRLQQEKRKYGAYDDGAGLRYEIAPLARKLRQTMLSNQRSDCFGDSSLPGSSCSFSAGSLERGSVLARSWHTTRLHCALGSFERLPRSIRSSGNIIGNLFKARDRIAGGTAGAIRQTASTGQVVGGTNHIQPELQRVQALDRVLSRGLNPIDAANARVLRQDLVNALGQAGVKVP